MAFWVCLLTEAQSLFHRQFILLTVALQLGKEFLRIVGTQRQGLELFSPRLRCQIQSVKFLLSKTTQTSRRLVLHRLFSLFGRGLLLVLGRSTLMLEVLLARLRLAPQDLLGLIVLTRC